MKNQTTFDIIITEKEFINLSTIIFPELEEEDMAQKFLDAVKKLDSNNIFNNQDYRKVNNDGKREYTITGAEKIASYLDETLVIQVKHWFSKRKQEDLEAKISATIKDNCSSLVLHNNQHFISALDLINILQTKKDTLNDILPEVAKAQDQPWEKEKDYYIEIDRDGNQEFYFSNAGIAKIVRQLKKRLKAKKDRLKWIETSANLFKETIDDVIEAIIKRQNNIEKAKNKAKTRDQKTCQVTNVKNDERKKVLGKTIKLVAHHLYSQNEYPHLVDSIDNLITIDEKVHDQFHIDYMGGTHNPCTIDDFIKFVQKYYPNNTKVITWLKLQKVKLGNPEKSSKRKPHILTQNPQRFLPPSYR
jgi:hypothetical protein